MIGKWRSMNISELKKNKEQLIELKEEMISRRKLLALDKRRISHPFPESSDDQATSSENDEIINMLDRRDSLELEEINQALQRIDKGEYGVCVACGDDISLERIKAIPFADKCIHCESDERKKYFQPT